MTADTPNKAAVMKMIKASEWATVTRGLSLLNTIADAEQWHILRMGITVDESGKLEANGGAINAFVDEQHKENVGLHVAAYSGMLDDVTRLDLSRFSYSPPHGIRRSRKVTEMGPLARLSKLTDLKIESADIQDVSALSHLTNLKTLSLHCESLRDISALRDLTNLTSLTLFWCNSLSDISALSGLTSLSSLRVVDGKSLRDLRPLAGLRNLKHLELSGMPELDEMLGLADLTQVEKLKLRSTVAKNVQALGNMTALTELNLNGCRALKDIEGLSKMAGLTELDLGNTAVREVAALQDLDSLRLLDLGSCFIKDLTPLTSGLSTLRMQRCKLGYSAADASAVLSQIGNMRNLQELDISYTSAREVGALHELTSLARLNIKQCRDIKDEQVEAFMAALPDCEVIRK